jgi:hypothetical protein
MSLRDAVTHKQALGWSGVAFAALLGILLTFSTAIVSRAEAAAGVAVDAKIGAIVRDTEERLNKRIDRVPAQVVCQIDPKRCP